MPPKGAPRRGAPAGTGTRANANANATSASPAASTADTQTPGPGRAPVQRLQSLKKRAPSGSIGPSAGAAGGSGGKPVPGPGEQPAKPTLKYKPRAVGRRSKEEREAMEKLEAQRHRERLAEAAAIQRGRGTSGPGGRGGFGRGRGGAMGSAGPLGAGMAGRRGRGGGRFAQDSRHSSMSRRSRSVIDMGSAAVSRDVSSDESDSIRVERHEHEERTVSVNMESSSSKSAELREQAKTKAKGDDDALFVQDDDDEEDEGDAAAAATTEGGGAKVKAEPKDDDDHVMVDVPHAEEAATTDDGFLPVQKVKVRRRLSPPETDSTPTSDSDTPVAKDPKSLLRTKEDIEEYERHEQDLEIVKDLFQKEPEPEPEPKEPQTEPTETPAEGEGEGEAPEVVANDQDKGKAKEEDKEDTAEEEEEEEESKDKLAGQLFLMQFPPMTPNLVVPGSNSSGNGNGNGNGSGESGEGQGPATEFTAEAGVKREEGVEVVDGGEEAAATRGSSKVVTASDWGLSAGRAGKLNVHASGRVTMDWGGISFELDRATAVDFLQEALIVSTPPNAADEEFPDDEKKVWAMGQLSGKFTVMPDWSRML
ncbi:hypothetical protein BO71DRAFT_401137 [Aspergillus ellipticus CBS 707.79]|uniref:DNA-directed RNA polymerase III RPC4 n=1 Tax=Aspergillus ellipticus CBS 707.79 TaxID=1448320 RepID=A0A319D2H4_9EURO|nr:hypothetical protein BO71DRAFT_401137 [Aspergillus ellipticus CBS 707.79]